MVIQGGKVVYGRTMKTGDYENKRVDVELSFTIDEGQDADVVVSEVGRMAVAKAHELLNVKAKTGEPLAETPSGSKETYAAQANAAERAPRKPPAAPNKKTTVSIQPKDELDDVKPVEAKTAAEAVEAKTAAAEAVEAKTAPADDWETAAVAEPPKEVTDKELSDACTRKMTELTKDHQGAAPGMVRKLIGSFFAEPAGKTLRDLPQPKRQEFLEKLKELK